MITPPDVLLANMSTRQRGLEKTEPVRQQERLSGFFFKDTLESETRRCA
jgi:hypothetical protein